LAKEASEWIHVASSSDVPPGGVKAVKLAEGRSVALFNVEGRIYATGNQCPHMGYPLSRGAVRHGILTCDWHGRSFDLEGGGCFNFECDDLETFAVDLREGEIWIRSGQAQDRRREEHLRLLWQGLLSRDRWTISKAIALLLKEGVAEEDIVEMILRHLGRRIASARGDEAESGDGVSRLINGLKVGRRYEGADRLMVLATAACSVAGDAAERLEVVRLPGEVAWDSIDRWTRMFSYDGQSGRIERCLFTAFHAGFEPGILPLLYACAVEPHFLGFADNLMSLGYLAEFVQSFGWTQSSELVFNLGAKLIGRRRGEPERFRRDAVELMKAMTANFQMTDLPSNVSGGYDEDAFGAALLSADIRRSFEAVNAQLKAGVKLDRLITTLVLQAADRMARTPVNVDAGWDPLTRELNLAASLRTAQKLGGDRAAATGLFHAAWLIFSNRWLNIPARPLTAPLAEGKLAVDEDAGVRLVLHSISSLNVHDVGTQVLQYLNAGHSGDRLLHEMGRAMLWDDTNMRVLPTLRTVFDEWERSAGNDSAMGADHPARYQLLVALARYATDIRTNKDSGAATNTAMRFAEGKTTVEAFEQ
jgi:nitrite reductase/ring-hydroxylating ferredoxin subunit